MYMDPKHTNILQPTSQLPYMIIDNDNIAHHFNFLPMIMTMIIQSNKMVPLKTLMVFLSNYSH